MTSNPKAVFQCLRAFIPSERYVVVIAIVFLLINLFLAVVMGSVISWYDTRNNQELSTQRSELGRHISQKVLAVMPSSGSSTPLSLAGATFVVHTPTASRQEEGEKWVEFSGGQIAQDPAQADLLLSYQPNNTWVVSSVREQSPELGLMGWFVLRRLAPEFRHLHKLSEMPSPNAATVVLKGNTTNEDDKDKSAPLKGMIGLLFHYSTVFPCLGLLVISSGILSYQIERERATGALEAFSMAVRPMWVLFLSRALARTTLPTLVCTIMLAVSFTFAGFPHPIVYLLLVVCMWCGALLLNLVGQLHVVWFHHRWSRFIASALFNPIIPAGMAFAFFGGKLADKVIDRMKYSDSLYSGLPLVSTPPDQAIVFAQVFIPLCLAGVVVLSFFLEWRLGTRRQGLARLD